MSTFVRTDEEQEVDRQVRARVLAGIRALEKKYGPDWWRVIDLDTLRLASPRYCVLGQVYGDYKTGKAMLGIDVMDRASASALGFNTPDRNDSFDPLQLAWEVEIKRRKEGE